MIDCVSIASVRIKICVSRWLQSYLLGTCKLELHELAEGSLDSKEIKPVNLKGDQPWIFTGRTDAEAEARVFWLPDMNRWLIGKVPDAGKDWGQKEKKEGIRGWGGWMASPMQWTWTWANSRRRWGTGRPSILQSMGSQRVWHHWVMNNNKKQELFSISTLLPHRQSKLKQ